jgi:threonine synthase
LYQSTRNKNITASSSEAIVRGIAADGGLFMFSSESDIKIDVLSLMGKPTFFMATEILSKLLPDFSKE